MRRLLQQDQSAMCKRFDLLDPIQRLKALGHSATSIDHPLFRSLCPLSALSLEPVAALPRNQLIEQLLLLCRALYEFAQAVRFVLGYEKHAYVLGDSSLLELLRGFPQAEPLIRGSGLPASLEALATLGLIHRFPVARKFGYNVPELVQIRLNGWGQYLIEQAVDADPHYTMQRRARDLLIGSSSDYHLLLEFCDSSQRPLPILRIHEINARLQLPMVT